MTDIKAIETRYDGHRFRSRLEARWACFYNALGIRYEYEKEGYDLGVLWTQYQRENQPPWYDIDPVNLGWYLPDFWLPEQSCWIEIKGAYPTEIEIDRCCALEQLTHCESFIFYSARFEHGEHGGK